MDNAERCGICFQPMKNVAVTCHHCDHGYHLSHIMSWVEIEDTCPLCRTGQHGFGNQILSLNKKQLEENIIMSENKIGVSNTSSSTPCYYFHYNRKYAKADDISMLIYRLEEKAREFGHDTKRYRINLDSSLYRKPVEHPITQIMVKITPSGYETIPKEQLWELNDLYQEIDKEVLRYMKS